MQELYFWIAECKWNSNTSTKPSTKYSCNKFSRGFGYNSYSSSTKISLNFGTIKNLLNYYFTPICKCSAVLPYKHELQATYIVFYYSSIISSNGHDSTFFLKFFFLNESWVVILLWSRFLW